MSNEDRIKFEREVEMIEFYAMAKRYGFCTPFCECGLCREDIRYSLL
jgi:hypothetical protein